MLTEQEEIAYIKEHHKSSKSFDDYMNYFAYIAAFPVLGGGAVIMITSIRNEMISNKYKFVLLGFFLLFFGLSMLYLVNKRLKENRMFVSLSWKGSFQEKKDTIINIASKTLRISHIEAFDDNEYVRLRTKASLTSWGEYVTIICSEKEILINSRPPASQFLTLYKDKQNINRLTTAFEEYLDQ